MEVEWRRRFYTSNEDIDGLNVYDANDNILAAINNHDLEFGSVTALSIDEDGRYLIGDKGNERVHILRIDYHIENGSVVIDNAENIVSFGTAGASLGHFSDIRDVETVKHIINGTVKKF